MMLRALLPVAALILLAPACDDYDPPPETGLVIPTSGQWTKSTPIALRFTEAIRPETLAISLYPNDLDAEGDLVPTAAALATACHPGEPCGEVAVTLASDGLTAEVSVGDLLDGKEGQLVILEVAAGLQDLQGRTRKVADWFKFQLSAETVEGAVTADLDSGVAGIIADLEFVIPGTRLRMYLDMGVAAADGATQVVGTVATLLPEVTELSSTDIHDFSLYGPDQGGFSWVVWLSGQTFDLGDGRFVFKSDKKDLQLRALGSIDVELYELYMELTFKPDAGEGGRATVAGSMAATDWAYGVGDLTLQGKPALSTIVGDTFLAAELPAALPRVCDAEPCKPVTDLGGLCYLPPVWTPGPSCP